ncbi:MAG: arginine--tRNA ligase [Clostridia bacterium]|nr:arginine--tRNA ligase [Clostridia bacterium]
MDFKLEIVKLLKVDLPQEEIYSLLSKTADESFGDYTFPCFKLAKSLRKSPVAIAQDLANEFPCDGIVSKVEAKNGYLNFYLDKVSAQADILRNIESAGSTYGESNVGQGKTICIDYSSVNIAKPFHIGHLYTTAIGSSLYKLYKALGYNVVGINHLGDWGTQFGKLIVAYKLWGDDDKIAKGGTHALQEIYVKFHQEAENNPQLEDQARQWFAKIEKGDQEAMRLFELFKGITLEEVKKIYTRLNVQFDSWAGESFYNDKMQPVVDLLKDKNLLKEDNGAQIVDLSDYNMSPCLILKSDGSTLYATRDLAAAVYRKQTYDFDKCLYVVAYQQSLHFKQFFKVLELAGFDWHKDMVHVSYGLVSLEEGAMSTRKGNTVWLDDVLNKSCAKALQIINEKNSSLENKEAVAEAVGSGAVVFSALQNAKIKDVVFSYDKMLNFDGETCPYLQYTHARCNSVLAKAPTLNVPVDYSALDNAESWTLVKLLNSFEETIATSATKYEPCLLSKYLIDTAQAFNKFYFEHRILTDNANKTVALLQVVKSTQKVLKKGLALLGIATPEKM